MIYREVPTRKFLPTLERYEPQILDHTATKYLKECFRKYFFRIVLARKSRKERNAVVFAWGNAIHAFFEEVYQTADFDKAFAQALKKYKAPSPMDSKKDQEIYSIRRLMLVCKACWEFYTKEVQRGHVKVLGIEQPFIIQLPDGTMTGGRMDQHAQIAGRTWPRDWKSTSKQINFFAMGFNPNDQATRYTYAASVLAGWNPRDRSTDHRKVEGIQFIVIQNMQALSSIKIEAVPVTKSVEELLSWEADQMLWYKMLDTCRTLDHWPKSENNCSWCDYQEVCKISSDSSREFFLKDKFDVSPWDFMKVGQEIKK